MGEVLDLMKKITSDRKLSKYFLRDPERCLKEHGLDPSKIFYTITSGKPSGELSDKDLEDVSGGHHEDTHTDYAAGMGCGEACAAADYHTDYHDTHFDFWHYWDIT